MAPVIGYSSQIGLGTAVPVTQRFDFLGDNVGLQEELVNLRGLQGIRSETVERLRVGTRKVMGTLRFHPNVAELRTLLNFVTGGTPTGGGPITYPLADQIPSFYVVSDKTIKVHTFSTCYASKLTVHGAQGEPLEITMEVAGTDETVGNSGTFPVLSIDVATTPFMFYDLILTIASSTYQVKDFTLTIDNKLIVDRFLNTQTLTAIPPSDRSVTLDLMLPYGDASAVYNSGSAGISATAVFTNGSNVFTVSTPKLAFARNTPDVAGRVEVMFPVRGRALKSGATDQVTMSV